MPTIAQLAQIRNNPFGSEIFSTVQTATPILDTLDTREMVGRSYISLARTGIPVAGGFKDLNEGASSGQVTFKMGRVDARRIYVVVSEPKRSTDTWDEENMLPGGAMLDEDWFTLQTKGRLETEKLNLEKCIIYGTAIDAKSFPGFKQLTATSLASNTLALADTAASTGFVKEVVNAGGNSANLTSSVYSVSEGSRGVVLRAGGIGGMANFLQMSEVKEQFAPDPGDSSKEQEYYKSAGEGWVGLSVQGADQVSAERSYVQRALRRLCNITPTTGLTELMLDKLVAAHGPSAPPTRLFMSYRSGELYQASKSPGSVIFMMGASGDANKASFTQRPDLQNNHRGIPIVYSQWINDDEAVETPA